jgi:hypothetical protein
MRTASVFFGLLLLTVPAAVQAQFSYTTNADGVTLTITGYSGTPSVGPVDIPTNINGLTVVNIGDGAFAGVGLGQPTPDYYPTSVTIPGSVTNIGVEAFLYCPNLTTATIANGVASIGGNAFSGCTSLMNITIPESVASIGGNAFYACGSLTSATIANGVKSIAGSVFAYDGALTNVTIPASVTNIGLTPFVDCTSLKAIPVDPQNAFYISLNGVLFDSNQDTLLEYPGGKVGSYAIPGSVTSVGAYAFFDCTTLTSVTMPSSITNIGDYAFGFCTDLTSVYFQGNYPTVGQAAFYDNNPTIYYLPGTTGWSPEFAVPWTLPNPVILNNVSNFGLLSNAFGFTISWATNVSVVVEACTNLANPVWTTLQTLQLTNGSFYFSQPFQTNSNGRFYRIRSP